MCVRTGCVSIDVLKASTVQKKKKSCLYNTSNFFQCTDISKTESKTIYKMVASSQVMILVSVYVKNRNISKDYCVSINVSIYMYFELTSYLLHGESDNFSLSCQETTLELGPATFTYFLRISSCNFNSKYHS